MSCQGRQAYDNYWQHFGMFRDPRMKLKSYDHISTFEQGTCKVEEPDSFSSPNSDTYI